MKLKKWLGFLLSLMMTVAVCAGISACGLPKVSPKEYVTITWYDGETVIKTSDTHEKGTPIAQTEKPSEAQLVKEGYTFDDWYVKAVGGAKFDFTKAIEENTSIYGRWTKNGEEPPVHTHTYGEWTVTKPTMTEKGSATRACTAEDCDESTGATQSVELPALNTEDAYTLVHTAEPTCTVDGTDTYTLKAETSISFTVAVDAIGHDMTENPADPATCERAGTLKYYTCEHEEGVYYADEEGKVKLESIVDPQKSHNYEGAKWEHDTTGHWQVCTICGKQQSEHQAHDTKGKDGVEGACSVCGYKAETPVEHTHVYGEWTVSKQPTAQDTGTATRSCTAQDCDNSEDKTETKQLPVLNETNYTVAHTTAATCENKGTDKYTYTFDDETTVSFDVEVPTTAHTYNDEPTWVWVGNDTDGYTKATATFTCSVCGKGEQTVEDTQIDVEQKEVGCTTDKIYTAEVTLNDKTYTAVKTVNISGQHDYGDLLPGKPATCLEEGEKEHYHCAKCQKDFDKEHNEITDGLTIPKKDHQMQEHARKEATCTTPGNELYYTCSNEGDDNYYKDINGNEKWDSQEATVIPVKAHEYKEIAEQPATCTKEGVQKHYHCDECDQDFLDKNGEAVDKEQLKIEKLGHKFDESDWVITNPTVDNTGTATKTCPNCTDEEEGHTITVELPKLSEKEKYTGVTDDTATCTDGGEQEYTYTDPAHPEYGEIKFTVETEAKGHTFDGTKWDHDDEKHWQKCVVCGADDETKEEHQFSSDEHKCKCGAYEKYTLTFDLGDAVGLEPVEDKVVYADEPDINLPGAPARKDYNFKGWKCEADNQIYEVNHRYTATQSTKFTAQWEKIPATQCPYNFYITGNGAGDLSRSGSYGARVDQFCLTPSMSGDNTVYTYESIEIFNGDNFKIISDMDSEIWAAGTYFSFGDLTKTNANFKDGGGGNIQATASGRYKIVLTVDQKGKKVSFEIITLETYTNVQEELKGYYLTGFMTDPAWVQGPTDYKLELTSGKYTGVFYLDQSASHATDGKTEVKVIKVTALKVGDREAGYTVEWIPVQNGDNYAIPSTGWYTFTLTVSNGYFTVKTATAHTHNYTWQVTQEPNEKTAGSATATCKGTGDVPCDKKEIHVTLPALKEENGYTVTGKPSCKEQVEIKYEITLEEHLFTFTVTAEQLPHEPDGTWHSDANNHWYVCKNCQSTYEQTAHTFENHLCTTCQYAAKKVTAHFALGYGEETVEDIVKYADENVSSITLPTPENRVGYKFDGWLLNNAGEEQTGEYAITFGEEDTTLAFTAKWTAITYTVKYESEGAEYKDLPQTPADLKLDGTTTVELDALTLTGYTFNGWYVGETALEDAEGSYTFTLNETTIGALEGKTEITFTAKWTVNSYTIHFELNKPEQAQGTIEPSTVADIPNVTIEAAHNTITLTQLTGLTSHTFNGWTLGDTNGTLHTETQATLDEKIIAAAQQSDGKLVITFYASWTEIGKVVATFDYGVAGMQNPAQESVYPSEEITFPAGKDRTGYTFEGWQKKGVEVGDPYKAEAKLAITENTNFVAVWTPIKYTVKLENGGHGGDLTDTSRTLTLEENNNSLTFEELTQAGYTNTGWTIDGYEQSANYTGTFRLTADLIEKLTAAETLTENTITLTAQWTVKTYQVKFESEQSAANEQLPTTPTTISLDDASKTVTLKKLEDITGYTFAGWYVGETALNTTDEGATYTFTLTEKNLPADDATVTITAKWEKLTKVTFKYHETETVKYYAKDVKNIPANDFPAEIADTDTEKFLGWFDGDTQYTHETELTGDVELTAEFAKFVAVKWYVDGVQQNEVTVEEKAYWVGAKVTENAYTPEEKDGYILDGWYTQESYEGKYEFDTPLTEEGLTLYARWLKAKITVRFFDEDGTEFTGHSVTIDNGQVPTLYKPADKGYTTKAGSYLIWEAKDWYLEAAHQTKYTNTALIEDTDLYLKWTEKSGTAYNGGTFIIVGATSANPKSSLKDLVAWDPSSATKPLQKDTSLKYHTVYTITLDLYAGDVFTVIEKGANEKTWSSKRYGINNLLEAEKKYDGKVVITGNGTSDNNLQINAGGEGRYKFILAFNSIGSTAYFTYELLEHFDIDHSQDKTGYFLVGSMTGWADAGCEPIYLGELTASGTLTTIVTITANDYQVNNGVKSDHAEAKVVTGTISGDVFIVTSWSVMGETNYSFLKNTTGTFRVTFTITSTTAHTGTLSAEQVISYTISFSIGEEAQGTPPQPQTAERNTKITLPTDEDFSRAGYRFDGWSDGSTTYKAGTQYTVNATKVLNAVWIAQYSVSFSANEKDGGTIPEGGTVDEGKYTIPAGEPTRVGYDFLGWYVGETYQENETTLYKFGDKQNGNYDLKSNTTFKAAWKAISYTVNFETDYAKAPTSVTVTLEKATIDLTQDPYTLIAKGYTLKGWTLDKESGEEKLIKQFELTEALIGGLEGDAKEFTVYAVWEVRPYTLEVQHSPALREEETVELGNLNGKSITIGAQFDLPELLERDGYNFSNWTIRGIIHSGSVTLDASMIEDETTDKVILTANWAEVGNVTITFDMNAGEDVDNVKNMPDNATVKAKSNYEIPAQEPSRKGYEFKGWYIDEQYGEGTTTLYKYETDHSSYQLEEANVTFHAHWVAKEYDVIFTSVHGEPTTKNGKVSLEKAIDLETLSAEGWRFDGWTYNDELYTDSFTLTADMIPDSDDGFTLTFTAKWSREITVKWHVLGGDEEIHTAKYYSSEAISEENTSPYNPQKEGYVLDGWYKNNSYTEEYDFTEVLEDTADTLDLYGRFIRETITVTYIGQDGKTITTQQFTTDKADPHSAVVDTTSTDKGTVKRFFTFQHWSTDQSADKAFTSGTEIIDDLTLYAWCTEDTSDAYVATSEDNRSYYLIGQGRYVSSTERSTLNSGSHWSLTPTGTSLVFKKDTSYKHHNVYTLTGVKLYEYDVMKLIFSTSGTYAWGDNNSHAYGAHFFGLWDSTLFATSTAWDDNAELKVNQSGTYTITLITKKANTSRSSTDDIIDMEFERTAQASTVTAYYVCGTMTGSNWDTSKVHDDLALKPDLSGSTTATTTKWSYTGYFGASDKFKVIKWTKKSTGNTFVDWMAPSPDNYGIWEGAATYKITYTVNSTDLSVVKQ